MASHSPLVVAAAFVFVTELGHLAMASTQFSRLRDAPVQSVQELIKKPIPAVPQPFILDDPQPPILSTSTPLPLLPTIDMKHLIINETADSELEKLHSTCKEWGFFSGFSQNP
ncbi:hypothetical protein CK203_062695 [Vitis vinifera]|uniref:Protein SRG1 n=1 Tax=Vitis vinifera TaxID=29760 RepID=A0A438GGE9_VITVI|nr:hypothetical protein CK203_062695 [Vitis vinifera]